VKKALNYGKEFLELSPKECEAKIGKIILEKKLTEDYDPYVQIYKNIQELNNPKKKIENIVKFVDFEHSPKICEILFTKLNLNVFEQTKTRIIHLSFEILESIYANQ
jgi:hypothetical protein